MAMGPSVTMGTIANIRRAHPEEGDLLTAIAVRSKAYWGYDEEFMASAREVLEFRASEFLPDFHVYILEVEGRPAGFCSLSPVNEETIRLNDLFIEPGQIRKGYGKQLWDYSMKLARSLGFKKIVLASDPNAEPFYIRLGAVRVGEVASPYRSDPNRKRPVMEFVLSE